MPNERLIALPSPYGSARFGTSVAGSVSLRSVAALRPPWPGSVWSEEPGPSEALKRREKMKSYKRVYAIIKKEGRDDQWIPAGVAFVNLDQSLNVHLDVLPRDGNVVLHIRDPKRRKET